MLQRRFIHLLKTLSGLAFQGRNTHNSSLFWKRALVFLPWYIGGLFFAIIDLLFLGYLVSVIMYLTHGNGRKLTNEELELFASLGNDQDYLKTVWVYEQSWLARFGALLVRRKSLGLGLANTIHFTRVINMGEEVDKRWLVHEIAHTLQFKYRGLIYVPEALIAQQFSGYDFGGRGTLETAKKLRSFNPEQQADMFVVMQLSDFQSEIRQEVENGNW